MEQNRTDKLYPRRRPAEKRNTMHKHLFLILFLSLYFALPAQETAVYQDGILTDYKRGMDFYEKGLYGQAQLELRKLQTRTAPPQAPYWESLRKEGELYSAKSAVNLKQEEAERLVSQFLAENSPSPAAAKAAFEIANYYYNNGKYREAARFFEMLSPGDLSRKQMEEAYFKLGYCYFVRKKFDRADKYFNRTRTNPDSKFYYPSNYYHGMVQFFDGRFDDAAKSFELVERSPKFRPYIPFYLAQIYYAQGLYDKVIDYGTSRLKTPRLRKKPEINLLIGKAYYAKGEFDKALPYLEAAAKRLRKMTPEDFYQLAYTQYRTGNCQKATKNFGQLAKVKSKLGQIAMYFMADCYIKLGQKSNARNALKRAAGLDFDPALRKNALYNYAKLSYELGYDVEALRLFQSLVKDPEYGRRAQKFLSAIFLNTKDYARALEMLDQMPEHAKSDDLKETHQKVALYRALQLYNRGDLDGALKLLRRSRTLADDTYATALAYFWEGEILHRKGQYAASRDAIAQYLRLAKNLSDLPPEASVYAADYTQGYNYLKLKDYSRALNYFQSAIAEIKRQAPMIEDDFIKTKMLGDAVVRAGDCYFKKNKLAKAARHYDEAVRNQYPDYIYALYQKAIIEGLRGHTESKIIALEKLARDYPNSPYADDALLQAAITYMEIDKNEQAKTPLKKLVRDYKGKSNLINQALLRLGLIAYNDEQSDMAINYYKQVFLNNPKPDEAKTALTALKEIYTDQNRTEEYTAFLRTIPGYQVSDQEEEKLFFEAAETQYENASYDKAIKAFTKYLKKYPNGPHSIQALYHRAESFGQLKKYDRAMDDFEAIVDRGPSEYYLKAVEKAATIAYNIQQDFAKAFALYNKWEKAADKPEKKLDAQLGALQSAYRINNESAVRQTAQKLIQNPNADKSQKALAWFYTGKLAFDNKHNDEALEAFNKVTRLAPNTVEAAEARYRIAYIYYVKRELDMTVTLCENGMKANQSHPYWAAKLLILLADTKTEQGELTDAQAALETIIEYFPDNPELLKEAKAKLEIVKKKQEAESRLLKAGDDDQLEMDIAPE